MGYRVVDLSVPLENGVSSDPPGYGYSIQYLNHQETFPFWEKRYPGLQIEDLPDREAFALERLSLSTHNGTHVDAPWHYASATEAGAPMPKIDELPLEWFFGPGVKLDFRDRDDGYVLSASDLEEALAQIGHELSPGEIVLINTSAGKRYGHPDYIERGCGIGRDATVFLTDNGIRVAGTDAWGWDAPVKYMAQEYQRTKDPSHIWQGHKAGRIQPYSHIEKLHNLEILPATGFLVSCFPIKIKSASAGWTRAVAIFEK